MSTKTYTKRGRRLVNKFVLKQKTTIFVPDYD